MTLRTLNYGNYGIVLVMGNAGFCPSTVPWGPNRCLRNPELEARTFGLQAHGLRLYPKGPKDPWV